MTHVSPVRADKRFEEECIQYSICTLVSRPDEYSNMVASFRKGGFVEPHCEFLYLDNTHGNKLDSYSGNNLFLNVAKGQLIILCHQDVVLLQDGRVELDAVLAKLSQRDANWAVCGNAGIDLQGKIAIRISDSHGDDQNVGNFPVRVQSLDENFLVLRRQANVAFSNNIEGFHLYGADVCLLAEVLGNTSYVVNFHLRHKSGGLIDKRFFEVRNRFVRKYELAFRSRWIGTTCTAFFISGLPFMGRLITWAFETRIGQMINRRLNRLRG